MSRVGKKIIDRLERLANDLEQGIIIPKKHTCRQIVLDNLPHPSLGPRTIMGYAISYTSLEPVTAEQWKAIRECVTQLNKGYTWLGCEPIHFSREEDGSVYGSSKPNFDPAPEDRASAATEGLPDGTVRELLDGLCLISRRCGVDWEVGDDHTEVIGYIRQGDFDDAVWEHIDGLAEATSFTQTMTGDEHFEDPDDLGDSDPDEGDDGPLIFRFPGR